MTMTESRDQDSTRHPARFGQVLRGFPRVLASLSSTSARLPTENSGSLNPLQMTQALQTLGEMETLLAAAYTDLRLYVDDPAHLVAIFNAQLKRRYVAEAADTLKELAKLKSLDAHIVPALQDALSECANRLATELQELPARGS